MSSQNWIARAWRSRPDATTFAAVTHESLLSPQTPPPHYRNKSTDSIPGFTTLRQYDRARQRRQLLLGGLPRQLMTVGLCALCALLLKIYSLKDYLTAADRRACFGLVMFTGVLVALNFAAACRSYARILRWRILASDDWPIEQFDLILKNGEMPSVLKLIFSARRPKGNYLPSRTQIFGVLWLLLNFGGAISIALLTLTIHLERQSTTITKPGPVTSLDLNSDALANNIFQYGIYSRPRISTPAVGEYANLRPSDTQHIVYKGFESTYEVSKCADDCKTPASYTFQDRSASNPTLSGSSDRTVQALAECTAYDVSELTSSIITFVAEDQTLQSLPLPPLTSLNLSTLSDTTLCLPLPPANLPCGPSCATILGLYFSALGTLPTLYICTNTISTSATLTVPERLTTALTLSLAGGHPVSAPEETYSLFSSTSHSPAWSLAPPPGENHIAQVAARHIAGFSMAALAVADSDTLVSLGIMNQEARASRLTTRGRRPYHPWSLSIDWLYALPLLLLIPPLQATIMILSILWATHVIVRDDSDLATAKLLVPLFARSRRLYDHGCLLNGSEIVDCFGGRDLKVRYGVEAYEKGGVYIGRTCVKRRGDGTLLGRDFVEGGYD